MKEFPVRNIFLPAALAASAVFSGLTLPIVLQQSTQNMGNALPVLGQSTQVVLNQVHKDIAIPYIGTTIVLSAGAGIVTAELMRKRYAAQKKMVMQAIEISGVTGNSLSNAAAETGPSPLSALPLADSTFEWPTTERAAATSSADETPLSYEFPLTMANAAWPESPDSKVSTEADLETDDTVVVFPGQYQRCRIQVPHLPEQLYAIEFNEQFYRLLNAGMAKDQALAAIRQLNQENCVAILTRMNQGYAVWVLESQAELVSAA